MRTKNRFILSAWMMMAALSATAAAGEVQPPPMKETKPSLSEPWEFVVEPYGWALGIDGQTGVGGLTTSVDISPIDVLRHIDWFAFLAVEVRKGKWGLMADGFLAQLSDAGDPPGPFYYSANVQLRQGLAELALTYRLAQGKHGFLDVFAGARYNYIGLDLTANINTGGVQKVSDNTSDRIAGRLSNLAEAIVAAGPPPLEEELRRQLANEAKERLQKEWDSLPDGIHDFLRRPGVRDVLRAVSDETNALAKAIAQRELAAAGSAARAAAEKRAKDAEQDLADALSKEIKKRLPTNASGNEQWVDPFVGLRGQLNLTDRLFLAARGDIGGFGVGSHLVMQAIVSAGYNFSKNVFAEAGYRYLKTDYTNGGFTFDVAQGGPFMGLGIRF